MRAVRRILVPTIRSRWASFNACLLTFLAATAVGVVIVMGTRWSLGMPATMPNTSALITFTGVMIFGTACAMACWVYGRRRTAALRHRDCADRLHRLARFREHAAARIRYPHRLLEAALLEVRSTGARICERELHGHARALRATIHLVPPNFVAVIGTRRDSRAPAWIGTERFEPIDADDRRAVEAFCAQINREHLDAYCAPSTLAQSCPADAPSAPEPSGASAGAEHARRQYLDSRTRVALRWTRVVAILLFLTVVLGVLLYYLCSAAYGVVIGTRRVPVWLVLFVSALVGWFVIRRTMLHLRTYLVPRGLIAARHPFWRTRGSAWYARRGSTPLISDHVTGAIFVRVASTPRYVRTRYDFCAESKRPHLLAWHSRAPSPTPDAVQAFLGDDVELSLAD